MYNELQVRGERPFSWRVRFFPEIETNSKMRPDLLILRLKNAGGGVEIKNSNRKHARDLSFNMKRSKMQEIKLPPDCEFPNGKLVHLLLLQAERVRRDINAPLVMLRSDVFREGTPGSPAPFRGTIAYE